jgi:hypothetical protein
MNPILVFFFLAVFQIAVAATGCIVAFLITLAPSIKGFRWKGIRASLFGASGSFLGVIIAYVSILVAGFFWKIIELFRLGGPAIFLAEAAPWLLIGGYMVGLVGGSYIGWKFRIPAFRVWGSSV